MINAEYCGVMARYNRWMNSRLYEVCAGIADEERRRERGAFFGSIMGTLNHLLYGDEAWLGRFVQREIPKVIAKDSGGDFDMLRERRAALDQEIIGWADGVSADWLAQPFRYTSNVDGITRELPAWMLVTHMFNHQTHHRGQLTTLLSQIKVDYGITDLPWLPELDAPVKD